MDKNYLLEWKKANKKPDIRELTLINGITFPSNEELIMLILGRGTQSNPIEKLSAEVMNVIETSSEKDIIEKLKMISGMGTSKVLAVAASLELGRRMTEHKNKTIEKPTDILPFIKHFSLKKTEHFITVTLNGAHELMNLHVISIGTTNRALIHPREVFEPAVTEHASGIICCHNHPFGHCYPSKADLDSTKALQEAAMVLGICFMDHLIITQNEYFSFLEHGLLNEESKI